jgi:hypothetical protein
MTTSSALKFGQFVDLMMARLLEKERETPSGVLLDLNEVARELKVSVPDQWIFDAGKVMEGRGWAQVAFTFGGVLAALLEPLSRVASIGGFIADLVRLLNP